MDDDLRGTGALIGALGLGEVAGVLTVGPRYGFWMAFWVALAILALFALLFGGYHFYRRMRARRRREVFSAAIQAQTMVAPHSLSDPNQRAALDKLRQKFQVGLQEYKSRDKNIYDLPWYIIIGEPGSGKTEAIRHSGVDFPPGLQNELQGSGGTVNMDWWFTNHGIILDTAGRLLFDTTPAGQTPEWNEFLRLLKKARAQCPINGLFIVLSVESLIKDSADKISQKASRLAQQLDLIQRTLDVRFPVYLLVTKCDLLTGFRDFFESIDDPLLQHQVFGWSNPDSLDSRFRPDLVEEHLASVAERLRRRRLALLRESTARRLEDSSKLFRSPYQFSGAPSGARRVEEVESLFALPESVMRLAPRLRRYLETIFVAGEWSAKPVFLRGIYFTSSMREGTALDEAIAFATGLPLDQLPEDRSWDKDRAFFLRDLFLEKVFRECGLVTRATNTLKLLRTRQVALFGSMAAGLLLFLAFAAFGFSSLKESVLREASHWETGAANFDQGIWSRPIVSVSPENPLRFVYDGTNLVDRKQTLVDYHRDLKNVVNKDLKVGLVFRPISWLVPRGVSERAYAQRVLFEASVLNPIVRDTQEKMARPNALPRDLAAVARHRDALLELMQLEADGLVNGPGRGYITDTNAPQRCLRALFSYLTESDFNPDTNLVEVLAWAYAKEGGKHKPGWPPAHLLGGTTLASNKAIAVGLTNFYAAMMEAQTNISRRVTLMDNLVDRLQEYHQREQAWLSGGSENGLLRPDLVSAKAKLDAAWTQLRVQTNFTSGPITNLSQVYLTLETAASKASAAALLGPVSSIITRLPAQKRSSGLFQEIRDLLGKFVSQAAATVRTSLEARNSIIPVLERDQLPLVKGKPAQPALEARWSLYTQACSLASIPLDLSTNDIGSQWQRLREWTSQVAQFQTNALAYNGPLGEQANNLCDRITGLAAQNQRLKLVNDYVRLVAPRLAELSNGISGLGVVAQAKDFFAKVDDDLERAQPLGAEAKRLDPLRTSVSRSKRAVLEGIDSYLRRAELGFPVLADSGRIMDANSLLRSRQAV
jgi:hypothetical protein